MESNECVDSNFLSMIICLQIYTSDSGSPVKRIVVNRRPKFTFIAALNLASASAIGISLVTKIMKAPAGADASCSGGAKAT